MGGDRVPGPFNDAVDERDRDRIEFMKRHGVAEKVIKATLAQARADYIAGLLRLDGIAVDVYHGRRGNFLKKYADAWLAADPSNKKKMRPAWIEFIVKYNLEADPKGTGSSESRQDP